MNNNNKETILYQVRRALINNIDAKLLVSSARAFKSCEAAKVHGVRMAEVHMIAKAILQQIKKYPKHAIFELCEELWQSGYLEEAVIACKWSETLYKEYELADFAIFERWLSSYVTNWANCDSLCRQPIVLFVVRYPDHIAKLKEWAKSPNRWMRRGAAVTLTIPATKGFFLNHVFDIADILLLDKDSMVQNGYGWMLRTASEAGEMHQKAVFDYVMKNKSLMPRTTLRYIIEKMPASMKAEEMKK